MGNWSKVPALQIAGILGENGLASERELWIDNALKKFDRALVGQTSHHSICVLQDLRGPLASCDLPVFCLFYFFFSTIFYVSIFL